MDTGKTITHIGVVVWTSTANGSALHAMLKALHWLDPLGRSHHAEGQVGFACTQSSPLSDEALNDLAHRFPHPFEQTMSKIESIGPSVNPHDRLQACVVEWMQEMEKTATEAHTNGLPTKWEALGDLIVIPMDAFANEVWIKALGGATKAQAEQLWAAVAHALGGARLARQDHISDNELRSPRVEMLAGESTWVEFSDYGVSFGFDASKVMFSSGNVTERHRIGSIDMKGETVVDAYAGAGYYTLPMLVRSQAGHVHACEMNPASIEGLKWAAAKNGVDEQLSVHEGDNQATLPKLVGVADRCHLGLLPSSEAVWQHALACLKPTGGWLHVHMNVKKEKVQSWSDETVQKLDEMAHFLGRDWSIEAKHIERVKSYSPGVLHVVLDVQCVPNRREV
jgi:tRNA wybutosine-synthesizing protein 3